MAPKRHGKKSVEDVEIDNGGPVKKRAEVEWIGGDEAVPAEEDAPLKKLAKKLSYKGKGKAEPAPLKKTAKNPTYKGKGKADEEPGIAEDNENDEPDIQDSALQPQIAPESRGGVNNNENVRRTVIYHRVFNEGETFSLVGPNNDPTSTLPVGTGPANLWLELDDSGNGLLYFRPDRRNDLDEANGGPSERGGAGVGRGNANFGGFGGGEGRGSGIWRRSGSGEGLVENAEGNANPLFDNSNIFGRGRGWGPALNPPNTHPPSLGMIPPGWVVEEDGSISFTVKAKDRPFVPAPPRGIFGQSGGMSMPQGNGFPSGFGPNTSSGNAGGGQSLFREL